MLDILFVLLLFFMVAAGSVKHEASIATQLPGSGNGPSPKIPVQITIDADGQVNINSAPVDTPTGDDLPETISRLKGILGNNPEQPIIISPTASTKQQRVVDVLNACTAAGVKDLAFGALNQ